MANKFFRKLNGLLTAAALCVSCLPFGGMLSASAADVQETIPGMTQSPEQLIQEADRGDFLTLGYAVMLDAATAVWDLLPRSPKKTVPFWTLTIPVPSTVQTFSC